jgi:prepilin-type N-terminal cleavage/methylation domain-containing protein
MVATKNKPNAFSLVELLVVIAVIGVISAIAIPSVSRMFENSTYAKNLHNAKSVEQMSSALASLGVAHVIPDSMGGVEATARLLREGVIVPEGPMAGEVFMLASLTDEDISQLASFLSIRYDMTELRLVMKELYTAILKVATQHLCYEIEPPAPARIEKIQIA